MAEQPAPEEHKKGGGLFVIKKSSPKEPPQPSVSTAEVSAISGRLRVIEERLSNLRRKMQLTDQNMLNTNKKLNSELKDLNTDFNNIRLDMEDLRGVIQQIITEMKKFANKQEVNVMKKYVEMWEPLNFVTRNEVESIIKDIIGEMQQK